MSVSTSQFHSGKMFSVIFVISSFIGYVSTQMDEFDDSSAAKFTSGVQDQKSAETGFGLGAGGGGGIENSKYFHYQHLPEHDKYEFGYRRGNDHHVRERHEKAVPHEGHFKTKVRWADHKGGHGEHYWDYNHAGHHDDGDREGSNPVPVFTDTHTNSRLFKNQPIEDASRRTYMGESAQSPDGEQHSATFMRSIQQQIGDIEGFDIAKEVEKPVKPNVKNLNFKKTPKSKDDFKKKVAPQLVFDLESGKVVDEATGKVYMLQAVEN